MDNRKPVFKIFVLALFLTAFLSPVLSVSAAGDTSTPDAASFKSICQRVKDPNDTTYGNYPPCATSPSKCGSAGKGGKEELTPLNCLFLEEPIGGETGYDLYKISCAPSTAPDKSNQTSGTYKCFYTLWYGEPITGEGNRGPVQAVLSYEEGKEYQGPFGLLYNYLGLIYKFMSGIIVGFVILLSIIGGIRMTISAGNQDEFRKGKGMIIKALIGMAIWFLASLILYTINPTFFAF